jgi:hypothetical protein
MQRQAAVPLPQFINRKLNKMELLNHLAESWMWNHSHLRFSEVAKSGHYIATRVTTASPVTEMPARNE